MMTAASCSKLAEIHHRQPRCLDASEIDLWLDPNTPAETITALLAKPGFDPGINILDSNE